MANEFGNDIVTVSDENGNDISFEILDRIETESGKYLALTPFYENKSESLNDDGELICVKVNEDGNETYLEPIENETEHEEVIEIFEKRLEEIYDIIDEEDIIK